MTENDSSKNDFVNMVNTVNIKSEKTVKTFKLDSETFSAGKRFAQLLGLTHSQLLDKAVSEFIQNHKTEVPIALNYNQTLKASLEIVAAIEAEAATHKFLLKQKIDILKSASDRQSRADHLLSLCEKLLKQVARTRRFLKAAKGYRDDEFLSLLSEAGQVVETVKRKNSGGSVPS